MPIRLLPPDVSSKIAAGEVVERPASVVKELVENSLDAGATDISVEVRGGGIEYIRVTDNGCGIASDEAEAAFQRFATSKISGASDLEAISTLGFRGEALPSIAAVSSVTLVSRSAYEDFGVRVEVTEGEVVQKERHGASPGTSVTVRQLFRNFPARRKFLRSVATETSRIQSLVTRYALAYPEVRFQLNVGDAVSFTSTGSGDLREAVAAVYGLDVAQAMLELRPGDDESLKVGGLVGPPSLDRANRGYVSFFVNRRWVQNRILGVALEQAYHGFLMERRYPIAVLSVAVPPEDVDVNVHPAKTEVRFRYDNKVFAAIQQAVRGALTAHSPVPEMRRVPSAPGVLPSRASPAPFWPVQPFQPPAQPHTAERHEPGYLPQTLQPAVPKKALPVLRVLGQVQNTYIVAEGPDGMYLIDQHAAHERVLFERVRADMAASTPQVQTLLEPALVQLGPAQAELVEKHPGLLSLAGFVIEPFGGEAYLLRGVPSILRDADPARAFGDILDMMAEGGDFESWDERAAYSIACHSAIRAGKALTHQEMVELARQLEDCQQPHTCPHGRPTIIHLSASHLEREFGRR